MEQARTLQGNLITMVAVLFFLSYVLSCGPRYVRVLNRERERLVASAGDSSRANGSEQPGSARAIWRQAVATIRPVLAESYSVTVENIRPITLEWKLSVANPFSRLTKLLKTAGSYMPYYAFAPSGLF